MKAIRHFFKKPAVNKVIHHVWLGSAPGDKVEDYVKAWAVANDGTRAGEAAGEPGGGPVRYQSKVWVDRNALLVADTRDHIIAWAEKKALAVSKLRGVDAFDRMRRDNKASKRFSELVAMFASRKRYELSDRINALESRNLDDAERLAFIAELNADLGGSDASEALRTTLASTLAQRQARIDTGLVQGDYEDINAVLDRRENALMKRAYRQELDLRQNMAAASDIARVVVLKQEGGVYVDVDLLPRFKDSVVLDIARALDDAGYHMNREPVQLWWKEPRSGDKPLDLSRIGPKFLEAVTDALVAKLKLIRGYPVAPVTAKPSDGGSANASDDESWDWSDDESEYATDDDPVAQRRILEEVVSKYVDAQIDNPYSVFQPLGELRPKHGFELAFKFNQGSWQFDPNNNFIASADSKLVGAVYKLIEKAYTFFFSEEGKALIKDFSTQYKKPENIEHFAETWERYTGLRYDEGTYSALLRYMQDGIVPESGITAVITGPSAFETMMKFMDQTDSSTRSHHFNDNTADDRESSWWTRDYTLREMRNRLFPDAEASGLDGSDPDPDYVPWQLPDEAYSNLIGDPDASFNYEHQFVIQMNGDSVAAEATFNLFSKHPEKSTYAQWRDGKLKVALGTREARAAQARGEAPNLSVDGPLRLTFVGHGKTSDGISRFADMTAAQFVDALSLLLRDSGVRPNNKLVINLVACNLDNHSNTGTTTFARRLTDSLPQVLRSLGLSPDLTDLHVREGRVHVNFDGTKSQDHIAYLFRDGSYVRDAPFIEGRPVAARVAPGLHHDSHAGAPSGRDAQANALIVVLGDHQDDLDIGAMLFNKDPGSSIYIQPDGNGQPKATVYIDNETGRFRLRAGLSRLKELKGDIRIHLVGTGTQSMTDSTFGGKSPSQVIELLTRFLATTGSPLDTRITIVLSGRGLVDASVTSEATFMGQFSETLALGLGRHGIDPNRVNVVTRIAHEHVDASGNRVFITPEGISLGGDLGTTYSALTDGHFVFDPQANAFIHHPMKMSELGELNRQLHALLKRTDLSAPEQAYLEEAGQEHLRAFRRATGALPVHAEGRTAREQALAELQDILKLRQERIDKLDRLDFPKEEGWKLDPLRARKAITGTGYEVGFIRALNPGDIVGDNDVKWVHTEEGVFMRWADRARDLGRTIRAGVKGLGEGGAHAARSMFSGEGEPAAVHTVTAMFLMQALIGPERSLLFADDDDALATLAARPLAALSEAEKTALRHRLTYIRAQIGTNYAQLTSGLVMDGAHLAKIAQSLKDGAAHAASSMGKVASALGALGVVFDMANVVFASIDLSNASTISEKTEAGFRLGTTLVIAGCDIGALGAGYVAGAGAVAGAETGLVAGGVAGTIAGTLGYIAVPVIGLTIGVGEVIKGFDAIAEKVDAALHKLEDTMRALREAAFVVNDQVASFNNDLVLNSLDMNTGAVDYGSVLIRALKTHWIGVPTPASDADGNDIMLDMYAPFLPHDQGSIDQANTTRMMALKDAEAVILPMGLTHRYDFDLAPSPGWRFHHDFPGLDALEKAYPEQFVWWTYSLFADYSPVKLRVDYSDTTFQLKLDAAPREVVVPSVEQETYRSKLHYRLTGNGGHYTVALPRWATDLTLQSSASADEYWHFDISQAIRDYSAGGAGQIISNILTTLTLDVKGLRIGGKLWVGFDDVELKHASMSASLDDKGEIQLVLSAADGHWVPLLELPTLKGLASSELAALTKLLTTIGLKDRALRVMTKDGAQGVLDISGNLFLVMPQVDHADTAVLFNGRVLQNLPGLTAVALGFSEHTEDLQITLSWQATSEITAYSTYNMDTLISASIQMPTSLLERLFLNQGAFDQKLLKPWLDVLVPGMPITVFDGKGTMLSGVCNAGDPGEDAPALQNSSYRSAGESFVLTINRQALRATLEMIGHEGLSSHTTDDYLHLLDDVPALEIHALQNDHRHSINLGAGILQGRSVTLIDTGPVDLVISGTGFSWRFDGPDLLLQSPVEQGNERGDTHDGTYSLRWINVDRTGSTPHTLSVGSEPALPLMDALEKYEAGHFSLQAPRYNDPYTAVAQEEARRLRERDWDRSHLTDGHESHSVTSPWRLQQRTDYPGVMDVTFFRRRVLSIAKNDEPRAFVATKFEPDGFFVAWKVGYYASSSVFEDKGDISAYFSHGRSGRPHLEDVKLRMQAGHILRGMRRPDFPLGHLDALFKIGDNIQLFDDDGTYANARFVAAETWVIDDFSGIENGITLSVHRSSATLTIRDFDDTHLYLDRLNLDPIASDSYQTIDITLANHVLRRKTIHIDPLSKSLQGKVIKLHSTAPVDLSISDGQVTYRYEGNDLQIFAAGTLLLTWSGVGGDNASTHTVQIGHGPCTSVADILLVQAASSGDARIASHADIVVADTSYERDDGHVARDSLRRDAAAQKLVQAIAAYDEPHAVADIGLENWPAPSSALLAIVR